MGLKLKIEGECFELPNRKNRRVAVVEKLMWEAFANLGPEGLTELTEVIDFFAVGVERLAASSKQSPWRVGGV